MRFDPGLAPDWLRIGTDIIGGATFNGSFSLSGHTVLHIDSLSQTSVAEGSADLTLTVNGSNFTTQSAVLINGRKPLITTFVNPSQLQAVIPAAFLSEEGHFKLSVLDGESDFSNSVRFTVTDSRVPVLTASVEQGQIFQQIKLTGLVSDPAVEGHRVRIKWGDGAVQVIDLGVSSSAPFSVTHTFAQPGHVHHDTIVVTALDDDGVASAPLKFDVIV
jgi:hypothetical protein